MNFKYIPSAGRGSQIVGLRQRPGLNHSAIAGRSFVPTPVWVGICSGYSLPITNGSDYEELTFKHSVPRRWDQASDITFSVHCAIDTANTDKKFKLNFAWEHFSTGDIIPATSNNVPIEQSIVGAAAQYKSYKIDFTIDYDIDVGDAIVPGDTLVGKLTRIAASSAEITGEVIIIDWWLNYWRGYYGGA